MYQHTVRNRKLSPLQGIGVVALLLAAVFADSLLTKLIAPLTGDGAAALVFWALGILLALWTMRRFVLAYSYSLNSNMLRITYAYGRYQRAMAEIYLNNILSAGALEDVRRRYPDARVSRATRPTCPLEPLAVACRNNGRAEIFVLQPDEKIRQVLMERAKQNRK